MSAHDQAAVPAMSRLSAAITLALEVHAGQVDMGGAEYILHPLHVLSRVAERAAEATNPHEREALLCAAILHDCVEDAKDPGAVMSRIYAECGGRTLQAVDALTHRPHEPYADYIARVAPDWIARRVKDADREHNSDASRLPAGQATLTLDEIRQLYRE